MGYSGDHTKFVFEQISEISNFGSSNELQLASKELQLVSIELYIASMSNWQFYIDHSCYIIFIFRPSPYIVGLRDIYINKKLLYVYKCLYACLCPSTASQEQPISTKFCMDNTEALEGTIGLSIDDLEP